jgi:pimeloyl-ACP methyl ester carboxylesterase
MARERPHTGSVYDQGEWLDVAGLDTWVVRAGPRGGTPIVLLHGIPTSAFLYRDVMLAMHEERDVIAFDWPGFGSSAKPRRLELTHQARAAHLERLVDALGLERLDLVVHDVGGPPGLLYAVRRPERVRKLVVLNTTVFKRDYRPPLPALTQFVPGLRELSRPFFNKTTFERFFKLGLARPKRASRATLDAYWRLARRDGGLRAILDTWARFPEGTPAIQEIRMGMGSFPHPVLVLFGAEDRFLPPPIAERFAKSFPDATLQLLPGVGHFLQEDAPEEVADRLLAFLS